MDTNTSTSPAVTVVSPADAEAFRQGARWARFLGVAGMVLAVLMLLLGIFFSTFMRWFLSLQAANLPPEMADMQAAGVQDVLGVMSAVYLFIFTLTAVIYFIPALFLYQHGTRMRRAFGASFDATAFHQGVQALRKLFTFLGVVTLILLALYGILFLLGILVALVAGSAS
ncbi:MAG: hypothetical protein R2817_07915 [Flavobacteriales bacterium]